MARLQDLRPGCITGIIRRCGKPTCHCAQPDDPGHGPTLRLTYKAEGKTISEALPSPAMVRKVEREIGEFRRYQQISRDFVDVNEKICRLRPIEETLTPREKNGRSRPPGSHARSRSVSQGHLRRTTQDWPAGSGGHRNRDLFHAREHLWVLAGKLFPADDSQRKRWDSGLQKKLDAGKIEALVKQLRAFPAPSVEAADFWRVEADYFKRNRERMRYPQFRRQKLFVGSGVIEAACRTVIAKRLKQSGMFWTVRGANAIIALRCCRLNRQFDDYWGSRPRAA
jgi:hypothetical protein